MATIKSYTDLEQSKKLAEFLSPESADNIIVSFGSREGTTTLVMPKETLDVLRTPCEHEQKPAEKVEPNFNFNVGQWIVATGKCVYLITKIDGFNVTLVDVHGDEYVFDASSLDNAHLWTLADAKSGDALVDKWGNIGIYQGDTNAITWHSYCYCGVNKMFYDEGRHEFPCYPATKEQRDMLFQKMKEAGYTFDSEKKELKLLITNGGYFCESENCEQNPAEWSEEDEKNLRRAIRATKVVYPETADWLKSLKDRIQLQPKQEWDGTEIAPPIDSDVCG